MAKRGLDATLYILASKPSGSTTPDTTTNKGITDLSFTCDPGVIEVKARGYEYARTLTSIKSPTITFSIESDAPAVATLRTAFWGGTNVWAILTAANGETISGHFTVTKFDLDDALENEETFAVELRPSAAADAEFAHTNPSSNSGGGSA